MNIQAFNDLFPVLSSAAGPDREIDIALWMAEHNLRLVRRTPGYVMFRRASDRGRTRQIPEGTIPHYTASLDAARLLLPKFTDDGYSYLNMRCEFGEKPMVNLCNQQELFGHTAYGATLELAICTVAVMAKTYKKEESDHVDVRDGWDDWGAVDGAAAGGQRRDVRRGRSAGATSDGSR